VSVLARESAFVAHVGEKHVVLTLDGTGPMRVHRTVLLSSVGYKLRAGSYIGPRCVLGEAASGGARRYEDLYTTHLLDTWTQVTYPNWGCLDVFYEPDFYREVKATHGMYRVFDHIFEDGNVQFMAAGARVESGDYVPYTLEGMGTSESRVRYQRLLLMPEWQRRSSIYLRECEPERIVTVPRFSPEPPEYETPAPTWRERAADWLQEAADKLRGKP